LNIEKMKPITTNILEHMFKLAEEIMIREDWNYDERDIFLNDPVIRLIYGACAEELGKVREEIFFTENNLIKRIIEQFLPEEYYLPSPAHGIFYARPIDGVRTASINEENQFRLQRFDQAKKEYMCCPAGMFNVYNAEVEYLVFTNKFYYQDSRKKKLLFSGDSSIAPQANCLWIGINGLNEMMPLSELSLFFSIPSNTADQYALFNSLKFSKCSDGKNQITSNSGLPNQGSDYQEKMLDHSDYLIYKILQSTKTWYERHYITLHNLPAANPRQAGLPDEIKKTFKGTGIDMIDPSVCWFRLTFSSLLELSWIESMFCSINCFPAVNFKIETELFDVEDIPINIFPIASEDYFLAIQSVKGKIKTSPEKKNYRILDAGTRDAVGKEGDALFRPVSLNRLEPGKLKNLLNHLSNLLKEETILLTKDGNKDDVVKLTKLNNALTDFEQSIFVDKTENNRFTGNVIIKPFQNHSRIFIRFWTTAADSANDIRPLGREEGAKQCRMEFMPDIRPDSLRLITPVTGGRKQPSQEELTHMLRKLLITRGRVITIADIKAFCHEHFSPHKVNIDVTKNYMQGEKKAQGIIKVMNIRIEFLEKVAFSVDEMIFLKEELLEKLEQSSANVIPFRIEFAKTQ